MTDARQSAPAGACPDFEVLSCFADGELDAAGSAALSAHVAQCGRCDALAHKLREGFEAGQSPRDAGLGGAGCAGDETLLLYASGALAGEPGEAMAAHVAGCDACVAGLVRLQRRLRVAAAVATPVPPAVQRRAAAVLADAARELAPAVERPRPVVVHAPSLGERLRGWLRVPVLAPVAMAAAALLMVAVGQRPTSEPVGGERSRAVKAEPVAMRVRVADAPVYQRPSGQSEVVATLRRGATVTVAGEERGWYEVQLEGGTPGWVAREDLE
ncbi:MAG: SH3 domain-containing protein [Deltaproteobacteria bacterium]|nr:SH3 domain-containing protein [Deltaproteobacteria bacterium]